MKYKGKMKFVFTVDVEGEADTSLNELKKNLNKSVSDDLKSYIGCGASCMGTRLCYDYKISSIKRVKE